MRIKTISRGHAKYRYYQCSGHNQNPPICGVTTSFDATVLEQMVLGWLNQLIHSPQHIITGLRAQQEMEHRQNASLRERMNLIERRIVDTTQQLSKLLGLYLAGGDGFSQELLDEHKSQLEKVQRDLAREREDLAVHVKNVILSDDDITYLEQFCNAIREGLDAATLDDKRRYFDLLDVQGKVALENDEKVIYVKCKLGEQRLVRAATSHLSSTGETSTIRCACLPAVRSR
jgi:hypothetical protein